MKRLVNVKPLPRYRLRLRFEDGADGEVDLGDLVGKGVFAAWEDPKVFEEVGIDPTTGSVCWPGGIDLCPDRLYHDITGAPLPGGQRPSSVARPE